MYETALALHSILRLAIVILLLLAFLRALGGWLGGRNWSATDGLVGLLLIIAMDVQLVLGFLLYFLWSPVTEAARANMGAAMKDPLQRYWAVEHMVAMFGGVALVHVARAVSKNSKADKPRHRWMALATGIALALVAVRSPWPMFGPAELQERPLVRIAPLDGDA